MKLKDKLTPYPILSQFNDDYINSSFNSNIDVSMEPNSIKVSVDFNITDFVIEKMISEGKATYLVHVECPSTSYRQIKRTLDSHIELSVPATNLREDLEICTFVVSTSHIDSYSNPNFNPDYSGFSFDIDCGSILAIADAVTVSIKLNKDDLENLPSVVSIYEINDNSKNDGLISVDLDGHYICIGLHKEYYNKYRSLGKEVFKNSIMSMIILPAMVDVLNKIKYADNGNFEGDELRWYRVVTKILDDAGISIEDLDTKKGCEIITIAQKIFVDPIGNGLNELDEFINGFN